MSRLPRLHSDSDNPAAPSLSLSTSLGPSSTNNITTRSRSTMAGSTSTLKRKATAFEEENDDLAYEAQDQPRKLPAISSGIQRPGMNQPLRPSRTAVNMPKAGSRVAGPAPLTKPSAPNLSARTRATSAPPKSSGTIRSVSSSGSFANRAPAARAPLGRSVSGGPSRPSDQRITALQKQVSSIDSARAADTARLAQEMETERAALSGLKADHVTLSKELAAVRNQEITQRRELVYASDELEALKRRHAREIEEIEVSSRKKDRELRETKEDLRITQEDLERERETVTSLKSSIAQQSAAHISLTTQVNALQVQLSALQSSLNISSENASCLRFDLEAAQRRIKELETEVREAEMVRRKLHNMVQELKGNIRVFCRVRPLLPSDVPPEVASSSSTSSLVLVSKPGSPVPEDLEKLREEYLASIAYPDKFDHKEIVLSSSSENAMGQERKEKWNFSFDKVFEPDSTQEQVFEDISQLAQSCTDGYNVCIFAYGQTGSGKSFTMEGGSTPETMGMIPRAVEQVFKVVEDLKSKGWVYKMDGQFLEIYNETVNDLLGKGEFDKKKHEIKHEKGQTRVTDVVVVPLRSPTQVRSLLVTAQSRRTVAATFMNERSSRSHSVFTLRISGTNVQSGETCEGSLNLVDLAGSERLNSSGAGNDKERLKETQNINRSLSALGDVIAALGEKGEKADKHIPYRNSKLTYLLQNSLSGNSKTLMVLNLSPLLTHLNESLCSLRFATKVNNTTIGTAKRQTRLSN